MKDISHHLEIFGLYCAMGAVAATGLFVHIGPALRWWVGLPVAVAAAIAGMVVVHHAAGWYAHRHQLVDEQEVADR